MVIYLNCALKELRYAVRFQYQSRWFRQTFRILAGFVLVLGLSGCQTVIADQYQATVLTTFTWQVKYYENSKNDKTPRLEKFASTSLLTRNGIKPEGAVIGADDNGLWWPALPPRPTIDEVEQRKKSGEIFDKPQLLRIKKYQLTFQQENETVSLPTNYQVYRQVVKAYPERKSLKLTLGVANQSVEKAEPQ
ncbi:MAG: hypothetical protein F6K10_13305 [Moorea sp. SIO2B7]|nr:hypothetical protein [Moorena sp. SIO2B7]